MDPFLERLTDDRVSHVEDPLPRKTVNLFRNRQVIPVIVLHANVRKYVLDAQAFILWYSHVLHVGSRDELLRPVDEILEETKEESEMNS